VRMHGTCFCWRDLVTQPEQLGSDDRDRLCVEQLIASLETDRIDATDNAGSLAR
jgi:hypothetical protein